WRRIAIVVAGPAANLLLCVALLWVMFMVGRQDYAPVLGRVEGVAASAGLQRGDRLVAVDGRRVATWTDASLALAAPALDRHQQAEADDQPPDGADEVTHGGHPGAGCCGHRRGNGGRSSG